MLATQLEAARSQMAFTLGFHIILASVGMAFPALMLIAKRLSPWTHFWAGVPIAVTASAARSRSWR